MSENNNQGDRIKKTIKSLSKRVTPIYLDNFLFKMRVAKYKNFPRVVHIETTNKCNAKCPMCPRGKGLMKRPIGTMEMPLFEKIIDECQQHKETKIIPLYVDGEPLMDELLAERIKYLKNVCSRLYVLISTNASLFTKEKAKEILLVRPDRITLSLDGINKETYKKMRGLDYDRIVQNIVNLIEIKKDLNSHTRLVVRMLKTRLTYSEINEFKRFWEDKAVDVEIKQAHNFIDTDLSLYSSKKCHLYVPCQKLWRALSIDWNGNVPLCCRDYNEEQLLGNVNHQSIASIWKSEKMNNIKKIHLSRIQLKDLPPCNRCSEIKKDVAFFLT